METARLRRMQQPYRIERLLKAYILRSGLLPEGSYQIHPRVLPSELRGVLIRATEQRRVCAAWAHGFRTWLFTCDMPLDMSRQHGTPVLQVDLYDEDGGLKDSGAWTLDHAGKWHRCAEGSAC